MSEEQQVVISEVKKLLGENANLRRIVKLARPMLAAGDAVPEARRRLVRMIDQTMNP